MESRLENFLEAANKIAEINKQKSIKPSYFLHSYGCQQNLSDSERIAGLLEIMNYSATNTPLKSDLIIFNTCGVRHSANERVFGNIGALKNLKRKNKNLIICICGCMVEQKGMAKFLLKRFPFIDITLGTNLIHLLPSFLLRVITKEEKIIQTKISDEIIENLPIKRKSDPVCRIPIMYGCDNFCSYCIVPYVRGRERSREPNNIIKEIKEAIAEGKKEILLLGQNVNSYGKGLKEKTNFAKLLQQIVKLKGDFRVKFLTSHPKDMSAELIDVIAQNHKVCNFIHLPIQSGSNEILCKMNRKYTCEKYLELFHKIKDKLKDFSISSDIIVGFPGETDKDFEETLNLVKEIKFDFLFTFLYSKREGTKASEIPDLISVDEKRLRFERLIKIQEIISTEKHSEQIHKQRVVLPDHFKKVGEKTILAGKCEQHFLVEFEGEKDMLGNFVKTEIVNATRRTLIGKII